MGYMVGHRVQGNSDTFLARGGVSTAKEDPEAVITDDIAQRGGLARDIDLNGRDDLLIWVAVSGGDWAFMGGGGLLVPLLSKSFTDIVLP